MPVDRGWWLGGNKSNRAPNRYVFLDSEARQHDEHGRKVQSFRLAVVAVSRRDTNDAPWTHEPSRRFDDPEELWAWIARKCDQGRRTVLVAHNLAYDLRITKALYVLPDQGWSTGPPMMDRNRAMFRFTRNRKTLVTVDSMNWLPQSLERLGELIGVTKLPLPAWSAPDHVWAARCERDVTILRNVWFRLFEWHGDNDLGAWKPTGAGGAMAAYRHRFRTHRILIHHDEPTRAVERESAFTGRCEAWRHGRLTDGPWVEWDYRLGYANIMASSMVPTVFVAHVTRAGALTRWDRWPTRTVLARVKVDTDIPVLPYRDERGILWPVGQFETVAWGCELKAAQVAGARLELTEGWLYELRPALVDFAGWCLGLLDDDDTDPIVAVAVKHWTRAIVGKFGGQFRPWVDVAPSCPTLDDVELAQVVDARDVLPGDALNLAGRFYRQDAPTDSQQSAPQVMAWIQAMMRVRLWEAMQVAGLEHVAYVDTDGLIVDQEGSQRLVETGIPGLRVKRVWEQLRVLGPRQLVLDGQLRAAGIPRGATPNGTGSWSAEVWSELASGLRNGLGDRVTITRRVFDLAGIDRRRVHLAGGLTAPVRL